MFCAIVIILLIFTTYFSVKYFISIYSSKCKHEWETVEDRPFSYSDRLVSRRCKKCNEYKIKIYEAKI